jgi:hypothetical protein
MAECPLLDIDDLFEVFFLHFRVGVTRLHCCSPPSIRKDIQPDILSAG